ncbi:MAG: fatty acid desaturase [Pseudopedobacter saltans]|uniref:Fatty acid desaturase n=1 Tax=Pseudopedobacter saltans TaxID=151895 RepID=A0A2W5F9B1_9SPHI|nr:MAG: fatty acid desaturase [Pseudopedobacter saltans]
MELVKPVFEKEEIDGFYKKLKAEVQALVLENPELQRKNTQKAIFLLVVYWLFYALILLEGSNAFCLFAFYILMGVAMIVMFVNSIHDAAHQCAFRNKRWNNLYVKNLELFGGNSFIWVKRHNLLHHPHANIQDWDIDIKQSKLVRIFPNSVWEHYHRYQHIYMFFLYPFYTINWLFVRDFKDFFEKKDNILKRVVHIPRIEYLKLFFFKFLNIFYLLIVPYWILDQDFGTVFGAWMMMHLVSSMVGVVALVSTHADEEAEFPEAPIDGKMNTSWAVHQISVTKDFSANNRLATFLYGGFTHHVAHHLFPHLAHTYYPYITPIICRYANMYHIPYKSYPALAAIHSHFMLLKNRGIQENIFRVGEL